MKILIFFGLLLHLVFLLSIFYIYFQSPILKGIYPQSDLLHAPARRLVLFSCDGLRAESFLQAGGDRTPFMQDKILNEGIMGISHTRVPTESRPGHVALIAGFYEDPSAVFRGWKENPVEFDTVFNRSQLTYSWGSPDILPMFAKGAKAGKVFTSSYDSYEEDFSRGSETELLDIWVFDRVKEFLGDPEVVARLRKHDRLILFLHLLGMDTVGHVYKPHSDQFTKNLRIVDEGIKKIVDLVEETFEYDEKTAYVFTSDHGMTDRGSHGAGEPYETETPIVAWGAGVAHWRKMISTSPKQKGQIVKKINVPCFDIDQADVAPLMASLIGVACPINSLGKLPTIYLNVTDDYLAKATKNNAFQLLAQYKKWYEQSERKLVGWFQSKEEIHYQNVLNKLEMEVKTSFHQQDYSKTTESSKLMISTALEAIDYYQTYYKSELLLSVTLVMLGWMVILILELINNRANVAQKNRKKITKFVGIFASLILFFNYVQHTPMVATLYFTLPVIVWGIAAAYIVENFNSKTFATLVTFIAVYVVAAIVLVYSFFDRRILSVFLAINCLYQVFTSRSVQWTLKLTWLVSTLCLAVFPMLPIMKKNSESPLLLAAGTVLWMLYAGFRLMRQPKTKYSYLLTGLSLVAGLYFLFVIKTFVEHSSYTFGMRIASWLMSVLALLVPIYSAPSVLQRITSMAICFSIPYTMMSLSYENIFFFFYFINLLLWLRVETASVNNAKENNVKTYLGTRKVDRNIVTSRLLFNCCLRHSVLAKALPTSFAKTNEIKAENSISGSRVTELSHLSLNERLKAFFMMKQNEDLEQIFYTKVGVYKRNLAGADVRRTFLFMLYLFISFFGTGNIASISSFDPNWVRCYVAKFSPFLMATLIIIKIMLPLFILICILKALHIVTKLSISKLLISVLIVCDMMCLGFLYLVKNKGSWLDIGTSISHFIIMECTILVLTLIYGLASLYTSFDFFTKKTYSNVLPFSDRKKRYD